MSQPLMTSARDYCDSSDTLDSNSGDLSPNEFRSQSSCFSSMSMKNPRPLHSYPHNHYEDSDMIEKLQQQQHRLLHIQEGKQHHDDGVKAYAKLSGENWIFYVNKLSITLGRNSKNGGGGEESGSCVDVNLDRSPTVSRKHARLDFNFHTRKWEIMCLGRNGLRVNGYFVKPRGFPVSLFNG